MAWGSCSMYTLSMIAQGYNITKHTRTEEETKNSTVDAFMGDVWMAVSHYLP